MNSSLTILTRRHIMNITRLSRTGPDTYFVGVFLVALMTTMGCNTQATDNIRPNECSALTGGHRDLAKCEENKKLGIDTVKVKCCTSRRVHMWFRDFMGRKCS